MKTVLITGVCGGIGRALAAGLRDSGWSVIGTDKAQAPETLGLDKFVQGDVSDDGFWHDALLPETKAYSGLDGFIHNAAVQHCAPLLETTLEQWDETFGVNLRAAFLGIFHLAPLMRDRNAAIVNISSVHALATSLGMSSYAASKGGLLAFTRAAALELASFRIRVNTILPGAVETEMLASGLARSAGNAESARQSLVAQTPLKRIADPQEIAKAAEFLLDGTKSAFITGQSLVVDGGVLTKLASE